jgi:purine-binding chemotaxis protein CheW
MSAISAGSAAPIAGGQVVVFDLGGEEYALPIHHVREVIRYTTPRRVSGDPRVLGVISVRERLVPVVDVAQSLGLEVRPSAESKIVIVATGDAASAGVIVNRVNEVITLRDEEIEPLPVSDTESLGAIAKLGDRLLVLLDAERIFDGVQIETPAAE